MTQTPPSFSTTKLKLGPRRRSVSTPKMAIKRQTHWLVRIALFFLMGVLGAAAMWVYQNGRISTAPVSSNGIELAEDYKERLAKLTAERDRFSFTANAAESEITMERAVQKQLAAQVKALELENSQLKEDLAFFESLLPNTLGPQGVSIRRLKVDPVSPNQLRYRLLVMQRGKSDRRFVGNLQLIVNTMRDGKGAMMTFPEPIASEQEKFKLSFMHYQRVEGVLTLPDGVSTKLVQARVLENGQVRAQLSANL